MKKIIKNLWFWFTILIISWYSIVCHTLYTKLFPYIEKTHKLCYSWTIFAYTVPLLLFLIFLFINWNKQKGNRSLWKYLTEIKYRESVGVLDKIDVILYVSSVLLILYSLFFIHVLILDFMDLELINDDLYKYHVALFSLGLASFSIIRNIIVGRKQSRIYGLYAYRRLAWGMYMRARQSCYSVVKNWFFDKQTKDALEALSQQPTLKVYFCGPIENDENLPSFFWRLSSLRNLYSNQANNNRLFLYNIIGSVPRFVVVDTETLLSTSVDDDDDIHGTYYVNPQVANHYKQVYDRMTKQDAAERIIELLRDYFLPNHNILHPNVLIQKIIHTAKGSCELNRDNTFSDSYLQIGCVNITTNEFSRCIDWIIDTYLNGKSFTENGTTWRIARGQNNSLVLAN